MIICVVGPTGVGKTKMSVELAKKYNGIIVNCDAMQVYKEMDIATAKVTKEEKEGIKHYLFDICNLEDNYTIFDYQKDARKIIEENKNKNIIFVGGSGLYLKSALFDYRFSNDEDNNTYDNLTNEELYDLCVKKDKDMNIHVNNRKRLIRFLNRKEEEESYKILEDFFKTLGSSGISGQEKIFSLALENIDINYKEAKKKEKENIKLYRTLGISIGAMLAIFFI